MAVGEASPQTPLISGGLRPPGPLRAFFVSVLVKNSYPRGEGVFEIELISDNYVGLERVCVGGAKLQKFIMHRLPYRSETFRFCMEAGGSQPN